MRDHLVERGWGAAMGYPAMIPDEAGPEITVHVFHSADLPEHWARLDAFEGAGYARIAVPVATTEGSVQAFIYIDRPS